MALTITTSFDGDLVTFPVSDSHFHDHTPNFDSNFIFRSEHLFLKEALEEHKGHTYIFGGTGLGKTESAMQIASLVGRPTRYISMTGETTPDNFIGYNTVENGNIVFKRGVLLEAMEKGWLLIIDEIDYGLPSILSTLNMTMAQGFFFVPETQEKIVAHPDFRIVATANTAGVGDETGFYQGTNPLNRALLDRFKTVLEYTFPDKATLERILKVAVSSTYDFSKVLALSDEIQKGIFNENVHMTWGVRTILKFAEKLVRYGNKHSAWDLAKMSFANSLDSSSKNVVQNLVSMVFK